MKYSPLVSIVLFSACTLLAAAIPQSARSQSDPEASVAADIRVFGVVSDASTSQPVARASVTITRDVDGTPRSTTLLTDDLGRYVLNSGGPVGVEIPEPLSTDDYWIDTPFPNPRSAANGSFVVRYETPSGKPEPAEFEVYDILGRRVEANATLAGGVYLYRLRFRDGTTNTRAIILAGPGSLEATLVHRSTGASQSGSEGSMAKVAAVDVDFLVEKDGFVSVDQTLSLDETALNEANFGLSAAPAPTAAFTFSAAPQAGLPSTFDASTSSGASGESLRYSWDFGDGRHGGGAQVAHVYTAGSGYTATLTVTGNYGATSSTSQTVTIGPPPPPVRSDGVIVGTVRSPSSNPVQGATVEVLGGSASEVTDAFGKVTLTGLDVGVTVRLRITKPDFTTQYARLEMPESPTNPETFEATIRERHVFAPIENVENGAQRTGADGLRVILPIDALQHPDGRLATGSADVSMTPINVGMPEQRSTFPGVFEGYDEQGADGLLLSYGVAEFAFQKDGEPLQLVPGKTATVDIPIYTGGAALGETIPLWSVDEATGLWIKEGVGTVVESPGSPTGLALRAEVSHFSWWNCDDFDTTPVDREIRCIVVDEFMNREVVACWVAGASTGPGKNTVAEAPVYEVRTLVSATGASLPFPRGRQTDVAAVATLDNGEVWRGTAAVDGAVSTVPLEIELQRTAGGGDALEIALPADLQGSFDVPGETDTYSFTASAGQELFVFADFRAGNYRGTVSLKDPDGTQLAGFNIDINNRRQYRTVVLPKDGTYVVEVAETSFGTGTYVLSVKPTAEITLPFSSRTEVFQVTGAINVYAFDGTEGDVFAVAAAPNPDGRGVLDICPTTGDCILDNLNFSTREASTIIRLPATDRYFVLVPGSSAGTYTLSLQTPSEELALDTNHSLTLDRSEVALFTISAATGDTLGWGLSPDNPSGFSIELWGLDNEGVVKVVNERVVDMVHLIDRPNQIGRELVGPFYLLAKTARNALESATYGFALPRPRYADLQFDGTGQAILDETLDVYGRHILATFPASVGDGLEVLLGDGDAPPPDPTSLVMGVGPADDLDSFEYARLGFEVPSANVSLVLKPDASKSYLANIQHNNGALGDVRLTVNRVPGGPSIVVEGDTPCFGSTTKSLSAGLAAVTDGGTVTVCTGTHTMTTPVVLEAGGLTIAGQDPASSVVIADASEASFSEVRAITLSGDATFRDLTWKTDAKVTAVFTARASFLDPLPAITLENLTLDQLSGATSSGTVISGDMRRLTATNITHTGSTGVSMLSEVEENASLTDLALDGQLRLDATSARTLVAEVTNSQLNRGADFRSAASLTVRGCDVTLGGAFEVFRFSQVASATLENNTVTSNFQNLTLTGGGEMVIRGNTFEGFLSIEAGDGNLLVEKNLISSANTGSNAQVLDITHLTNLAPAALTIRNNVLEDVAVGSGFGIYGIIGLENVDLFQKVDIFNNSLRTGATSAPGKSAVGGSLNNAGFSGALPVTIVNNVFAGIGGTAISFPAGTTVDSDYNLFFNYGTTYEGVTTSTGTHDLHEPSDPGNPPPMFANSLLELEVGSPAIDAGAGTAEYPDLPADDYDGTVRPAGGGPDMGAHEQ